MERSLEWFLELGFRAVKIFLTAGPEQNLPGLRETEDRVARARELVGDGVELAVDAWLNPNVEYAVRLGEMLRPYRVKWMEDFLPADDLGRLRRGAAAAARHHAGLRRALVRHRQLRERRATAAGRHPAAPTCSGAAASATRCASATWPTPPASPSSPTAA